MTTPVSGVIAVLATLDTKGAEAALLKEELAGLGLRAAVVDVGPRAGAEADVTAQEVARAADHDLAVLGSRARRDAAMHAMAVGAGRLLERWHDGGYLLGVVGVGGNQGTSIAATAMRGLPIGLPKLMVSTVASGNVRGFVGDSDIVMMFSVGDLLGGPNGVTTGVLRRAAGAVAGMVRAGESTADPARTNGAARPRIAVTAFGNTHAAVMSALAELDRAGYDAVPFHASGASGSAMERLIEAGGFAGVLDLTTHELLGELFPADIYTPVRPGRLTAAGRAGIPQVVAPGGLEYHCFAAADTIPGPLRDRPVHHHNPNNTNVRATAEELARVASVLAARLNAAAGPVTVLIPERGWSEVGAPGGVLHDPVANRAFTDTLRGALADRVTLRVLDRTINDPDFAAAATAALLDHLAARPAPAAAR